MRLLIPAICLFLIAPEVSCPKAGTISEPKQSFSDTGEVEMSLFFPHLFEKHGGCLDSSFYVKVLIVNKTDTAVSLFEEWNMWGYFNMSFKISTTDSSYFLYKKGREWDKNYPSTKTLFPGDSIIFNYNLKELHCEHSQFYNTIPEPGTELKSIQAFYLTKTDINSDVVLKSFDRMIKYKYKYPDVIPVNRRREVKPFIVDSLKHEVSLIQTILLCELSSKEYFLSDFQ